MPDDCGLHIYDNRPRTKRWWRCSTCGARIETADLLPKCATDGTPLGRIPRPPADEEN